MASPKSQWTRELKRARDEGFDEGLAKGRQEILDWLEAAYLGPKAPDRDSPEGQAILQLAKDASQHFNSETKSKRGVRR